jgi:hypothetical protein
MRPEGLKFRERHLVQETERRLRRFFEGSNRKFESYAPDNNEQNFFDLSQHCADLIGCVDSWFPLLLEFKIFDGKVLPSFKQTQHEGLKILNAYGIPVRYCFNREATMNSSDDVEFLDSLAACLADPLPSRKPSSQHESLLDLLMTNGEGAYKLAPLAFCEKNVFATARVAELSTARLLLLTDKTILSLSPEQGAKLVARLWHLEQSLAAKPTKDWKRLNDEVLRLRQSCAAMAAELAALEMSIDDESSDDPAEEQRPHWRPGFG